jgi:glycosyltransferase involved in cell wall biosynthesis
MPYLSVVIPVYRAAECLEELHRRLTAALALVTESYEIILVEDCGGDGSWDIIARLAGRDPRVKGLQLSRNFGQHYAITAGLDGAKGEWVVVMDCDLQDAPEEIVRLHAKALEGYDVVVARRQERTDSRVKLFCSSIFYALFRYVSDIPYDGTVGNYRIISYRVVEALGQMRERLRFFAGMVDWMGFPATSIDVKHGHRFAGDSSYDLRRLFKLAKDAVIAYSNKPLRIAVGLGMAISAVSFAFGSYIIFRKLTYGIPVVGWSSLIVSIYFMGGLTFTLIGVIGIYLGEAFDEVKRRPLYVVRRATSDSPRPAPVAGA